MKKILALAIAVIMAAAILPAISFADEAPAVTYSVTDIDFVGKSIGAKEYYYLDVTEGSGMFSGHWLVDYPEGIVNIDNYSVSWSGGIQAQVAATWDDEEEWSDKPAFVCNAQYEGNTGGAPAGEPGNWYNNIGMYLTSAGGYMGLQMGGHIVRVRVEYARQPYFSECQQDENGWYVEVPVIVLESTYTVWGEGEHEGQYWYAPHDNVTAVSGKIYAEPQEDPFFGGTLTINYVYDNGAEAAPAYSEELEEGTEYSVASPFIAAYDPDIAVVEGVMPNGDVNVTVTYAPKTTYSVTYTGAVVDATAKTVGDTFNWTYSVSEHSYLWSGHWLIDYPEEYITPVNYSVTWSGGLQYLIGQTWDDEEAWSDKPAFVCNMAYEGQSGGAPAGEAGNWYSNCGMYLTSGDYYGVQMGGDCVRITFRIDVLPPSNRIDQDENGCYLAMPIEVLESQAYISRALNESGTGYVYTYRPHDEVESIPGKVYITAGAPIVEYTVNFYGLGGELIDTQVVEEGDPAVAPEVPEIVDNENGTWIFCGWDVEFDNITGDTEVHAQYWLLGDTDLGGTVTANDALMALRASLGLVTLNEAQIKVSDVDFNGSVSANDALKILRYTLGLIPSLAD